MRRAASRKIAGSGLPARPSSPPTTACGIGSMRRCENANAMLCLSPAVPTPMRSPRAIASAQKALKPATSAKTGANSSR
jgi:hypothetical protein